MVCIEWPHRGLMACHRLPRFVVPPSRESPPGLSKKASSNQSVCTLIGDSHSTIWRHAAAQVPVIVEKPASGVGLPRWCLASTEISSEQLAGGPDLVSRFEPLAPRDNTPDPGHSLPFRRT